MLLAGCRDALSVLVQCIHQRNCLVACKSGGWLTSEEIAQRGEAVFASSDSRRCWVACAV